MPFDNVTSSRWMCRSMKVLRASKTGHNLLSKGLFKNVPGWQPTSFSSNGNIYEDSVGVIRVFTYCKNWASGQYKRQKEMWKGLSLHQTTVLVNVKHQRVYWMRARQAGLTSPLVFIKSSWPFYKTQKWNQSSPGQDTRRTPQVRNWKRNPPAAWERNKHFRMCYASL